MGKRSAAKRTTGPRGPGGRGSTARTSRSWACVSRAPAAPAAATRPVTGGPRQPCSSARPGPFEGLASECDIVAMREIVPAASAPLTLVGEHADRVVTLVTVLPMAWPALVRADGSILVGLQINVGSGDASRDVADALLAALEAEPGEPVALGRVTADSPRLQDLVDPEGRRSRSPSTTSSSSGSTAPTGSPTTCVPHSSAPTRTPIRRSSSTSVPSAYWTQMGEKEHLRWVMPHDEEALLNALARLHAAGEDSLGEGTRFVGMFRAQGLVCPVWDLPLGTGAAAIEEPATAFGDRLAAALAVRAADERGAPGARRAHHAPGHPALAGMAVWRWARRVRARRRARTRLPRRSRAVDGGSPAGRTPTPGRRRVHPLTRLPAALRRRARHSADAAPRRPCAGTASGLAWTRRPHSRVLPACQF